jgi:dCTP deaminase
MYLSKPDMEKALKEKQILVEPLFPNAIQPASIDLHLGNKFYRFKRDKAAILDPKEDIRDHMELIEVPDDETFILHAGEFALGVTYEMIGVDLAHMAKLDGISSLGRLAVAIHITASTINPGHSLRVTLELYNFHHDSFIMYPKMPIAQMSFARLSSPVSKEDGYKGFYSDDDVPKPSQYFKNFLKGKNSWMNFKG